MFKKKFTPTLISIENNSLSNFYHRFMSDKKKIQKSPVGDKKLSLKRFCGCFRTQLILKFNFSNELLFKIAKKSWSKKKKKVSKIFCKVFLFWKTK